MMITTDSLSSLVTKLGQKSKQRYYSTDLITNKELLDTYNSGWIAKRYIKKTIGDMLKAPREIYFSDFDENDKTRFLKINQKFETSEVIKDALFNVLLFGECIVVAITDSQNLELPLSQDERVYRFVVLNKDEYQEKAPKNKIFQKDDSSFFKIGSAILHGSRVLKITSDIRSYGKKERQSFSDIQTALPIIKMFDTITMSVSDLIEECKIDIYKMEGFNEQIASGREDLVLNRISINQDIKGYANAIAMDKEDDYETKETNLNGIADLWAKACIVVAGALNRPITILFGEGAGGFSSGEEDNQSYYETINEAQETLLRPIYNFIDLFMLREIGKDDELLDFDFPSIDSINEKEKAEVLSIKAGAFSTLISSGIITESIALKELRDDGLISNITDEDINESELLSKGLDYGNTITEV